MGFDAILTNLIEHKFAKNAPANIAGAAPFTGKAFATPNEAYFAHADYIIQSAANNGILVLLAPLYLGYNCLDQGWCAEVKAATQAEMYAWGRWVGNRYKNFDNIMWVIGGDTDPSPVKAKVQAMVDGILSVDTRHPFTAHNARGQTAVAALGWGFVAERQQHLPEAARTTRAPFRRTTVPRCPSSISNRATMARVRMRSSCGTRPTERASPARSATCTATARCGASTRPPLRASATCPG